MKLLFTLFATLALALMVSIPAQAQTVTVNLSNNTPVVGETVVVTVTITNTDSVARTLGAQAGITPQVSSFTCHPGKAFYTATQNAVYQPGQSISYTTTLIAPDPSCVPNNDWVIYAQQSQTLGIVGGQHPSPCFGERNSIHITLCPTAQHDAPQDHRHEDRRSSRKDRRRGPGDS